MRSSKFIGKTRDLQSIKVRVELIIPGSSQK